MFQQEKRIFQGVLIALRVTVRQQKYEPYTFTNGADQDQD